MHGLMTELSRRHHLTAVTLVDDEFDIEECRRAGAAIRHLMERDLKPGDIVTRQSFMNAMRLTDGVPGALFGERTGFPLTIIEPALREAEAKGLIVRDHQRIAPTELGQRFLNDLQQIFL